ncbi:MAG: hypothetical protein ACK40L_11960 [Hydrogenophaga sp.]
MLDSRRNNTASQPLAAPFFPQPVGPQGSTTLLAQRAQQLVRAVATELGLDPEAADQAAAASMLGADDKTVMFLPLGLTDAGALSLVLGVVTSRSINQGPAASASAVSSLLQHAPGLLSAYSAALGTTPDGRWVLYRSLVAGTQDVRQVAETVQATVTLTDFVMDAAAPATN